MSKRSVALVVFVALLLAAQTVRASLVLTDDLVFTQTTLVSTTIDGLASELAQQGVPVDVGAMFHYDGSFALSQDAGGNTIGSFSGTLTGLYAGLNVSVAMSGDLLPVPPASADPDMEGKGSGTFGPGTVDVTLTVHTEDDKASVKGTFGSKDIKDGDNFKKTSDAVKKTTSYEGNITINGDPEILTVVINDEADKDKKRPFTGRILSSHLDVDLKGNFSAAPNPPPPPGQGFQIALDAQVGVAVPEPATLGTAGVGFVSLLWLAWWRRRGMG